MLKQLLKITIVIFMVGNLLEVGLMLKVAEALSALRNVRFVVLTILWCFVLGPALAVLITKTIRLDITTIRTKTWASDELGGSRL